MKRTYLNEDQILDMIKNVKNSLCISYMPTKSEMIKFYGNSTLSNAVSRHGGHKFFANLLELEFKNSCSLTGDINEDFIKSILEDKGFKVEKMPARHPYDLLVNNNVRIDVKSANPILSKVKCMSEFVFSINNQYPKCDIFIFVTILADGNKEIYIIPSCLIRQSQLGIGETSKYDCYKGRYDYIDTFSRLFDKVV